MTLGTYELTPGSDRWQSLLGFENVNEALAFFKDLPGKPKYKLFVFTDEIPNAIRQLRLAQGKTLQEVAEGMNATYTRSTISLIESGKRKVGLVTLADITQSLKIKNSIVFEGESADLKVDPVRITDIYDDEDLTPDSFS